MNRPDINLLILGVSVIFLGAIGIFMLFQARDSYQVSEAKGVVYALIGLVVAFMLLFGYIPLSIYNEERREYHE